MIYNYYCCCWFWPLPDTPKSLNALVLRFFQPVTRLLADLFASMPSVLLHPLPAQTFPNGAVLLGFQYFGQATVGEVASLSTKSTLSFCTLGRPVVTCLLLRPLWSISLANRFNQFLSFAVQEVAVGSSHIVSWRSNSAAIYSEPAFGSYSRNTKTSPSLTGSGEDSVSK